MKHTARYLRSLTVRAHVVIVAMCALAMLSTPAASSDSWQEAGVIIDYGDDRITWIWIPFDDPDTRVIDLLEMSDLDMVTVGFGGMGDAICQVDDTGCPAAECRTRMCQTTSSSPFWRFLKLGDGEWSFLGTGVSGAAVSDGDVFALSWSAETPDLPLATIDTVAASAGADREVSDPVASMRTEGESSNPGPSAAWGPAIGAVSVVVVAAVVLVLRARSTRGTAT